MADALSVSGRSVSRQSARGGAGGDRARLREKRASVQRALATVPESTIKKRAPTVPAVRGGKFQVDTAFAVLSSGVDGKDVAGELHAHDAAGKGELTYDEFRHALAKFGVVMDDEQARALTSEYDLDKVRDQEHGINARSVPQHPRILPINYSCMVY